MRFERPLRVASAAALTILSGFSGNLVAPQPAAAQVAAPSDADVRPMPNLTEPHADGVVLVKFKASAGATLRTGARQAIGAAPGIRVSNLARDTERLVLPAGVSVAQAVQALSANPNVEIVEPDYVVTHGATSNDPRYLDGSLWGMYGDTTTPSNVYGSQAGEAWANGRTGSSTVLIGVIDEGIQITHPDLDANIWSNPFDPIDGIDNDGNGFIDDTNGWDFFSNDRTVYDGAGDDHGTHVAGTIGAEGGNATGVAGVNWAVTLISAKFLGPSGGFTSGAISALDYITDLKTRHGLNIVATSNSWGGGGFSTLLRDAIRRSGDADMLFIAAAGNGGPDVIGDNNDVIANYPSNYDCSLKANGTSRGYDCVIAVANINSIGGKSTSSNFGLVTVDLGAPGSAIWSTVPTSSYASYSGTSMATPHVSGAAALCASINPALNAGQLRDAIISSVAPTASLAGITVTGGRLDIGAMLPKCEPAGGRNLTITTGSVDLSWTGGLNQTAYTLLQYNTATAATTLIPLGGGAVSYSDAAVTNGVMYCYVLAATDPTVLGLSDLECALPGSETGTFIPGGFNLVLNQSATATMKWTAPAGGVDSYLLNRIPLDGSGATSVALGSTATSSSQAVVAAGTCFQLIGLRGATFSLTDVLCGMPGVSTLSGATDELHALTSVTDRMAGVATGLTAFGNAVPTFAEE